MTTQYSTSVVEGMQALYGKGFLSPGGAEEMAVLLDGVDLAGRTVLDIGCGLGGAAVMLAGTFGARCVTSIDVAGDLVVRARETIREAGLAGKIETHHVTPGPLPFDDASFDVVFAKDVVCHVPDKAALFGEVARVLVPGGQVICADFTVPSGPEAAPHLYHAWIDAMRAYGLTFHFERTRGLRGGIQPGRSGHSLREGRHGAVTRSRAAGSGMGAGAESRAPEGGPGRGDVRQAHRRQHAAP